MTSTETTSTDVTSTETTSAGTSPSPADGAPALAEDRMAPEEAPRGTGRRGSERPTRTVLPPDAPQPRELAAPPAFADNATSTPFQMILPIVGALTSVTMMVVLRNGQPLFLMLAAVVFLVAVVGGIGFAVSSRGRASRQMRVQRARYLDYLERTREELAEETEQVRSLSRQLHPAPDGLLSFSRDVTRRWERRRRDADHLHARIGTAAVPWHQLEIPPEDTPVEPYDPSLLAEAELLRSTHGVIDGMPAVLDLSEAGVVAIIGAREDTVPLARALLAQLATHQLPEDLLLAAAVPQDQVSAWKGLDLLPHLQSTHLFDGPISARRVAPDIESLSSILGPELVDRIQAASSTRRSGERSAPGARLVVLADHHGQQARPVAAPDPSIPVRDLGVSIIHLLDDRLDEPDDVDVRLDLTGEPELHLDAGTPQARVLPVVPDAMPSWQFEAVARTLAAQRTLEAASGGGDEDTRLEITELLGIDPTQPLDQERLWRPRGPAEFLRVPFAMDDGGQPVLLDLKESAHQGMGPHGICVGATGSGKSEMLRTLVLSLALTHSPEDLAMVLVDYKGGAAFAPFATLPHLVGLIDNLADDPQLTVRARSSLQGEVVRRQKLLKDADSSPSITHYRELRKSRPELPPMPHLFVVIDEFGELLTAEREFVDLFLQIGRIGRSIGVHLLLSSQRLESGHLRGLDTYLSYSLALRTFSESESQMVINTSDAFHLPPLPGYGYLKVDTSVYQRFRAGYVSGPVPVTQRPVHEDEDAPRPFRLPTYNTISSGESDEDEGISTPRLQRPQVGRALVDEMVDGLHTDRFSLSPVWLPPLPSTLALGTLLEEQKAPGDLSAVIGRQDDPTLQTQNPWLLDLTRAGGHVMFVGAPQSGRSTALRTVAASLASQRTPQQVGVYGLDLTGSSLRRLEDFPHVGGVATRGDEGRMQRLLEEITGMLRQREALFKSQSIDSMAQFRRMHAAGDLPDVASADIVLLVDGYGALRSEFEGLESLFTPLMQQSSSYGIHLVVGMGRWGDMRMAHQTLFGNRIELRQNDPTDSNIDRKLAATIPAETPGRGLSDGSLLGQIALPILDEADADDVGAGLTEFAERVSETWAGPAAAPIRSLPAVLPIGEMPDEIDEPRSIPIGLRQDTMEPTFWEFLDTDQHLLVLGDAKSGKTTFLRSVAEGLVRRFTPDELAIAVIDPRGGVPEVIPEEYLAAHAKSAQQAAGLAQSIAAELEKRPERSEEENASTPRIVILVDDLDIVSAGGIEPLNALLPHMPSARDLKVHVILTRPVAGASRAMYAPMVLSVHETGGAILLMSGDRSEGQILPRVYAQHLPPGRGRYIRRGSRPFVMQVATDRPEDADETGVARPADGR